MIRHEVTGIVLAGGKSSRMGNNKAMLLFKGKPLIQHALDALKPICKNVVISAKVKSYEFTGCEIWQDDFPDQAPMVGIYSALKHSPHERNIILTCDMPLVTTRLFEHLLAAGDNYDVVVPRHHGDCIEPLCAIYNKSVLSKLEDLIRHQDLSLQRFIRQSKHMLAEIDSNLDFFTDQLFFNVNEPEDFRALENL